MLAYVTTHFVNHSLGLVSVQAMDRALAVIYGVWASTAGTILLYGAFAIHYCLALWSLWRRRSLRMPLPEALQMTLGFCIPFLLVEHVVVTRVADSFFNANYGYYSAVLVAFAVTTPWRGAMQLVVLVVAWIHAMIGLRFSLMLKPWYPRWQPVLFAAALLLPTVAILGAGEAALQMRAMAADPAFLAFVAKAYPHARPVAGEATIDRLVIWLRLGFLAALLLVLGARVARWQWQRLRGVVRLTYPSGRVVAVEPASPCSRPAGPPAYRMRRYAAGGGGARPAASVSSAWPRRCRRPTPTRSRCCNGSAPRLTCAWPASCARAAICR